MTHPVTISVTGHAERSVAPNRCVVHLSIGFDGASRAEAADAATASAAALAEAIRGVEHDLSRWSLDRVQHSRYRPYHPEGEKLPWNYRSSAGGAVTVRNLDAVSSIVDRLAGIEGVDITGIGWRLARKKQEKVIARVRDLAVQDALTKAHGYARSLGFENVTAVALADPGLLDGHRPDVDRPMMRSMAASAPTHGDRPTIDLVPKKLRVTADVEAQFEAR